VLPALSPYLLHLQKYVGYNTQQLVGYGK